MEVIKRESVFKIKELTDCDHQYNGNKITYLFFLCGLVLNNTWTGTGLRFGG